MAFESESLESGPLDEVVSLGAGAVDFNHSADQLLEVSPVRVVCLNAGHFGRGDEDVVDRSCASRFVWPLDCGRHIMTLATVPRWPAKRIFALCSMCLLSLDEDQDDSSVCAASSSRSRAI